VATLIAGFQEVMIGYSDSGKDAGRMAAAWALYEGQEQATHVGRAGYSRLWASAEGWRFSLTLLCSFKTPGSVHDRQDTSSPCNQSDTRERAAVAVS
jgi:hypothetical protein